MAKLKNTFSWSFSAANDFDECRRRRYWSKYAMWGGWENSASEESRTAYMLSKMDNRFSLMGRAAEDSIMWMLRRRQQQLPAGAEEAYETVARPFLLKSWKESRDGLWRQNAKKFCNLREHYYQRFESKEAETGAVAAIREQVQRCLTNFEEKTLPRLEHITREQEVLIETAATPGDVENFMLEGIKIYAIPDYVYRTGDRWHIIDWKAGKTKNDHLNQVALYGLWANIKYGIAPEQVTLYVEYLAHGQVAVSDLDAEKLEEIKTRIGESVGEMSEYLEDSDRRANIPLPKEEWELAADPDTCRHCNFYQLCKPELEA